MKHDYERRFNTYRYRGGTFRFGADGQIVDVETHQTICNSNDAIEWINANAHKQDVTLALRHAYPPDYRHTTAISDIAVRIGRSGRNRTNPQNFDYAAGE